MPRVKKKSHESCRKLICYKCGNKADRVMGPACRDVIQRALELSSDPAFWDEYWEDPKYPLGLCSTCRTHLYRLRDADYQDPQGIWSKWVFHEDIPLPNSQNSEGCQCNICKKVHPGGHHKENIYHKSPVKKGRRPVLPPSPVMMCPQCGIPARKGEGHKCTHANVVASMSRMAEKDPKASQMFAVKVIQAVPGSPAKGTKRLTRSLGGTPLSVHIPTPGPVKQKSGSKLSAEKVAAWEATTNMSTNMRNKSISFFNKSSETKLFQRNIKAKILQMKAELRKHFTVTRFETDGKTYLIAHVIDVESYIDLILGKRGPEALRRYFVEGKLLNRFSLDSGGGFLKLSLNIVDMVNAADHDRQAQLTGFHDSGLKGLHVVAIAEELEESHKAHEELFRLIKIEKVPYWIAADFKVDNIAAGIQACSSTCSCPYCNRKKKEFETAGTPRTIGRIRQMRDDWVSVGKSKRSKLRQYEGCEHYPALPGRDLDEEILDIIAPGELHIVLGIVNKVLTEIRKDWKSGIDEWFASLSLDKKGYQYEHNTDFNGKNCTDVLTHVGSLIEQTQGKHMFWIQPHLRTLQVLRKVVSSCFGFDLHPNFGAYIAEFKTAWKVLVDEYPDQFNFHYKIHILVCHVEVFVNRHGPLGPFSEQSGESVHCNWGSHWRDRYKNLPQFTPEERLVRAVVDLNHRRMSLLKDPSDSSQATEPEPMSSPSTEPEPMSQTTEPEQMSSQTTEPDQIGSLTTEFEFLSSQ